MAWLITALIWLYVAGIFATLFIVDDVLDTAKKVRLALFILAWPISVPVCLIAAVVS